MLNLEIPHHLNPTNYENLLEYRRTHVLRPPIVQSEATIYLHERGYKLGIDYQAYQAIEIVSKLRIMKEKIPCQKYLKNLYFLVT